MHMASSRPQLSVFTGRYGWGPSALGHNFRKRTRHHLSERGATHTTHMWSSALVARRCGQIFTVTLVAQWLHSGRVDRGRGVPVTAPHVQNCRGLRRGYNPRWKTTEKRKGVIPSPPPQCRGRLG